MRTGRRCVWPLLSSVGETKSEIELEKLRPEEAHRIRCGEPHFQKALGVSYAVMRSAKELPGNQMLG
jgi:hypothetical protein